jgi:hypothetical protein
MAPKEIRRLIKVWLEPGDDNVPDELKGLLDDIANRTVARHVRLIERYERGTLKIHLQVGTVHDGKRSDLCAVVHRPASLRMVEQLDAKDGLPGGVGKRGLRIAGSQSGEAQPAVLINVVEMVEDPERMSFGRAISSVVRLQSLNACRRLLGNPACNPRRSLFTLFVLPEKSLGLEDGELRPLGRSAAVGKDELPSKVVQAGPEVMETVPHEDAKAQGGVAGHESGRRGASVLHRVHGQSRKSGRPGMPYFPGRTCRGVLVPGRF